MRSSWTLLVALVVLDAWASVGGCGGASERGVRATTPAPRPAPGWIAEPGWHRVGHRPVQAPAISDGAARPHSYFSVVAFDSGEVVALNSWYHPQLFEYVPAASALVSRAFMFPHERLGNEDDVRWRIRARKGPTAAESLVFWHVMGWEEIGDENGSFGRDAAVFSTRPIQASPGVLPAAQARVVNMGEDADEVGVGPYRAGIDYDPRRSILFVSTDRSDRSVGHSLLQAFAVAPSTGRFEGRAVASAPGPAFRHAQTFLRADPAHGLVLTLAEDAWERDDPILYLVPYVPAGDGGVATFGAVQALDRAALQGPEVAVSAMPSEARDALFVEDGGHVWAIVAARALFLFDLGPIGGPYALGAPVGVVPLDFRAEAIQRIGDEIVVSSHGLVSFPLDSVLSVRGERRIEAEIVRLPYPTYELDVATIAGRRTIFLASGPEGLEIFEQGPVQVQGSTAVGPLVRETDRAVATRAGRAEILFESGRGLRTIAPPVMSQQGDLAFWAVTDAAHEVIVFVPAEGPPAIVAETGPASYRALGRPSLASGGRVAFWAASADGSQTIVQWSGQRAELARTDAETAALDQPELADTGAVVFARRSSAGASSLVVRAPDGALETVFADDEQWTLPSEEGAPARQYDVSPTGEVVFVKSRRADGHLVLSWWNGQLAADVQSDDREVNFPRMVTSGVASVRSWAAEVTRLRVVRAGPDGGPGVPTTVADRRTRHEDQFFGNFRSAAALSPDDVYFVAQPYVPPSLELRELGDTLYRSTGEGEGDGYEILVATRDAAEGGVVRNVLFEDAASAGHGAAFVLEIEHRDGAVTYALTRLPL